jgi:gamma-glutamyl-gamma-aminobutyrate hydrolase PuuD
MAERLIYVEDDYDSLYGKFWGNLGQICRNRKDFLAAPEKFDLVCFTGGEDVSPALYGHENLASGSNMGRDVREKEIFEIALQHRLPISGICRGAQFSNVMTGRAKMVQHLRRAHGGGHHRCETSDGELFEVTSSHHQMIVPGEGCEVLAWAEKRLELRDLVYGGPQEDLETLLDENGLVKVTEAIYYSHEKIFSCQFHAEWMDITSPAAQWQLRKTCELLFGEEYNGRNETQGKKSFTT